jgi:hypothetical protein
MARGRVIVYVDDDNVLTPSYLCSAVREFSERPRLGVAGGPVMPEFESPPPEWTREFWGLLALHEHGATPRIALGGPDAPWPNHAPVGAGLCVRREAAALYTAALAKQPARRQLDRTGRSLASGGDNDLVFTLLHGGWDAGYFPDLRVTHLIPSSRLKADYLARLNKGIQATWVRVLALHNACPWPPLSPLNANLRKLKAWFTYRAWASPITRIRWQGACGHFQGRTSLHCTMSPGISASHNE